MEHFIYRYSLNNLMRFFHNFKRIELKIHLSVFEYLSFVQTGDMTCDDANNMNVIKNMKASYMYSEPSGS